MLPDRHVPLAHIEDDIKRPLDIMEGVRYIGEGSGGHRWKTAGSNSFYGDGCLILIGQGGEGQGGEDKKVRDKEVRDKKVRTRR